MKTLIITAIMMSIAVSSLAATSITQAVFSITSSAVTSAPNLRVVPMDMKLAKDGNYQYMQTFTTSAGMTQNLFLTKDTTVPLSGLCLFVQVDQDTKMKLNSETAYTLVYSGVDTIRCFK